MRSIPNVITILRILASLSILIVSDKLFFPLYFFAGLTDIMDGWIARKMNWTSDFGTLLDSVADLIFFLVVVAKIIFSVKLPIFLLWGTFALILIRLATYLVGYIRFHQFSSLHTYLNKLTGLLLFLSPAILLFLSIKSFGIVLLISGFLSALEELLIVLTTEKLDKNVPTFLSKK